MAQADVKQSEFLDIKEVAQLLRLSTRTVVRRFEEGAIPGKKIGSKWRTTRTAMDKLFQSV
jgi:excisionase family DNA binding protein